MGNGDAAGRTPAPAIKVKTVRYSSRYLKVPLIMLS